MAYKIWKVSILSLEVYVAQNTNIPPAFFNISFTFLSFTFYHSLASEIDEGQRHFYKFINTDLLLQPAISICWWSLIISSEQHKGSSRLSAARWRWVLEPVLSTNILTSQLYCSLLIKRSLWIPHHFLFKKLLLCLAQVNVYISWCLASDWHLIQSVFPPPSCCLNKEINLLMLTFYLVSPK